MLPLFTIWTKCNWVLQWRSDTHVHIKIQINQYVNRPVTNIQNTRYNKPQKYIETHCNGKGLIVTAFFRKCVKCTRHQACQSFIFNIALIIMHQYAADATVSRHHPTLWERKLTSHTMRNITGRTRSVFQSFRFFFTFRWEGTQHFLGCHVSICNWSIEIKISFLQTGEQISEDRCQCAELRDTSLLSGA